MNNQLFPHFGGVVQSLLKDGIFANVKEPLSAAASDLSAQKSVTLVGEISLIGILAMAQVEAAFLDTGIAYTRLFLGSDNLPQSSCVIFSSEKDTQWDDSNKYLLIGKAQAESVMGQESSVRDGIIGPVAQAAAFAAIIAPEGVRVRKIRAWSGAGQWLRPTLDLVYDPVWTCLRDHLRDEGTVRIVPLPEVEMSGECGIEGISERSLVRLRKAWPTLDHDLRSSALSELLLNVVGTSGLSAARIEELGWHRVVAGHWPCDMATMLRNEVALWPTDADVNYAGSRLETLISQGYF